MERDDALDEDIEALRRACMIAGKALADSGDPSGAEGSDSEDDLDLLRSIQQRFLLPTTSENPLMLRPLNIAPSVDSGEEDDFETLRAIQRRFKQYENEATEEKRDEVSFECQNDAESDIPEEESRICEPLVVFPKAFQPENQQPSKDRSSNLCSRFPDSAQKFVDALKVNRSCQRFIRAKLIEIEAKVERIKELKKRVKCLMSLQDISKRRISRALCQRKDPRVRLISLPKERLSSRESTRKPLPLDYGPPENPHVSIYRNVLSRFPLSSNKPQWSKAEKENLAKGIKQQYQERALLTSMDFYRDPQINNLELSVDDIRFFLPMVNWARLASMYIPGRSGEECEARWFNHEDPIINHDPWTMNEEKKLLHIIQTEGIYNWIDISVSLGTHRTPFQCLVRYQRSLNPCILKKEWTEDEDSRLRAAVEDFGEDNWQLVASYLEGRTGPQCSNRWRKCLHPSRRKVGRWSVEEDKRLKVAVILFGAKNWNKIAQFIPGRTQVQCRERWVNCLNPSLKLQEWTEQEDTMLKQAIANYGYCWSKVASSVPPRTDNQCWRRWKVLFPDEVPLRQAAWRVQKAVLVTNFVDRRSERPLIGPSDFCISSNSDILFIGDHLKRKGEAPKRVTSGRHKVKEGRLALKEAGEGETVLKKGENKVDQAPEAGDASLQVVPLSADAPQKCSSRRRYKSAKDALERETVSKKRGRKLDQVPEAGDACLEVAPLSMGAPQKCSSRRRYKSARNVLEGETVSKNGENKFDQAPEAGEGCLEVAPLSMDAPQKCTSGRSYNSAGNVLEGETALKKGENKFDQAPGAGDASLEVVPLSTDAPRKRSSRKRYKSAKTVLEGETASKKRGKKLDEVPEAGDACLEVTPLSTDTPQRRSSRRRYPSAKNVREQETLSKKREKKLDQVPEADAFPEVATPSMDAPQKCPSRKRDTSAQNILERENCENTGTDTKKKRRRKSCGEMTSGAELIALPNEMLQI